MQFTIESTIFERFPGISLAVIVAHGLDNTAANAAVEEYWRSAWSEAGKAAREYGNAQSNPHVQPWRERFRAMGVSSKAFPSSIEALLRRALKGGEPFQINSLVDFYNAISLRFIVPAGALDLAHMHDTLELRITRPGDTFTALDKDTPLAVPAGEVAYVCGHDVLTRHFIWRQARSALITSDTQSIFLVSEVLGELGRAVAEQVLTAFNDGLQQFFAIQPHAFLLDAEHSAISW